MIKKLIYICAVMVGSLSGLSSCSLDIPPSDQYSDPDAIVDISTARSLLSSVYSLYPHYEYELSILGDDFCPTSIVVQMLQRRTFVSGCFVLQNMQTVC